MYFIANAPPTSVLNYSKRAGQCQRRILDKAVFTAYTPAFDLCATLNPTVYPELDFRAKMLPCGRRLSQILFSTRIHDEPRS